MPSKYGSDRDRSRGRSRHCSHSHSGSHSRSKEQRFIDNWNAFMKSYSHEYTNGYYTGPKSYHPNYPNDPKVLSGDAPRRRVPKAITYYNDNDSGPDTGKDKGKGRDYSLPRSGHGSSSRHSRSHHSSHGGGSYHGSGYATPPYAPDSYYYPGYMPSYTPEQSQGYPREYYPYPRNSGYEANGQEHYTLNGATVFTAEHPEDMAGPSSSVRGHTRSGRDYSRGRTRHRDHSSGPAYGYECDYSCGRPSSISSNAAYVSYSRSASYAPSYISGRSYSLPPSRSHSRGVEDVSYGSGSYYSSGVSYGGANVVTAEHPDDTYRSTSRAPSSSSRHRHHSHHRRSKSLHSPIRYYSRPPSPKWGREYIRHMEEIYKKPRRHYSRHHSSRHRSRDRIPSPTHSHRHRSHHHHHHSRPRSSSRCIEESYYSSRTSCKGKKKSSGFFNKVKDFFH
ncbi:hypothetical protein Sste5346_003874 [Sporothrix stenoceras]|uniref:Uncharacterized protein n=1 Tax=Sporothrix stenoceras TaxID=5173 RepID=A0ABR3ZA88_9PEZI